MDVWATRIRDLDPYECDRFLCHLNAEQQRKIERLRREEDRMRSFLGDLLIRVYAAERWGIQGAGFSLGKTEFGKPYLAQNPQCHFNVSHSGDWVVSAFDHAPIGIDVEKIGDVDLSIADHFFAPEEVLELRQQPPDQQIQHFYRLWTLKESYIKAKGVGLSIPLHAFRFELANDEIHFRSTLDSDSWQFQRYVIDAGYELAVCSRRQQPHFLHSVQVLPANDLLQRFSLLG